MSTRLTSQELVQEFYEKNKDKFPDLTYEQVRDCATTQFLYLKENMKSGNLLTIRLKYFGTFVVYPKKAASILDRITKQFKELRLDAKTYFEKKQMLENFLKKNNYEK